MVSVLFVCMGNICRSPMAEGAFRARAKAVGLLEKSHGIFVDSAGTTHYHAGQSPDPRAIALTSRLGFSIENQRARQALASDFETFDYILAMDRDNFHYLERIAPEQHQHKLSLMLSHAPQVRLDEVPDPYYGGEDGFERCFHLINKAAEGLLDKILAKHFPDHRQDAS
ncbi:protein-tyrosine-phosphatase [Iodidimonas gelatinilytica]|uniref:protein-tyrosine-phosphatase n=1 Tax=Iodidimonas gelatinilytica TaxID=1236966 RepID=A0A5A7MT23_9PROT|nr:low molecular weight protein-tyrosine-phosphatase [Iodidimonas gelatinilytica]GEQ98956.1 protein-tyrosine-phosphatase [Iodidimonas gelatinilytica]